MRSFLLIALVLAACGGEEKKAEPAKPAEPPKAVEAPKPPPPPPAAPAASGPYTPDDLAKAAYEKAKTAGADAKTNPKSGDAAAIAAGKTKYDQLCSSCHGAAGMGDGVAGAALPQKPAAFTHKERWDATSTGVKHWIIQNGIAGTGMAGFVADEAQAWEVLAYVETLASAAPAAPAAAPADVHARLAEDGHPRVELRQRHHHRAAAQGPAEGHGDRAEGHPH